jgi:hypothetical protein
MKYIVAHGGAAHLDDAMACALAMAGKGSPIACDPPVASWSGVLPIERRDPTDRELEDPEVLVIDVGGRYEPAKGNFDHHQFPKGDSRCAMLLLASHVRAPGSEFELMAEVLPRVFPWWRTAVTIDQQGPFKAASDTGLEWSQVRPFVGPLAEVYLQMFASADITPQARGELVFNTLTRFVEDRVFARLDAERNIVLRDVGGVDVLDLTRVERPELCGMPVACAMADSLGKTRGVMVYVAAPRRSGETWRSTGLTLRRVGKDMSVDFTRVKDDPAVKFAHANGFLAQLEGRDWNDAERLITIACQ